MSLRRQWTEEQITNFIAPALNGGEACIKFDNKSDAECFRFACYSLRRRKGIGKGLSFILNISTASDEIETKIDINVTVQPTPIFELKRVKNGLDNNES